MTTPPGVKKRMFTKEVVGGRVKGTRRDRKVGLKKGRPRNKGPAGQKNVEEVQRSVKRLQSRPENATW